MITGGPFDFVFDTLSQTLTNKTLTTPTIGDYTNATHNHQNAGGGGILGKLALPSSIAYEDEANIFTEAQTFGGDVSLLVDNELFFDGLGGNNSIRHEVIAAIDRTIFKIDGFDTMILFPGNVSFEREDLAGFFGIKRVYTVAPANVDSVGTLGFRGEDSDNNLTNYSLITCQSSDVTSGAEGGTLRFSVADTLSAGGLINYIELKGNTQQVLIQKNLVLTDTDIVLSAGTGTKIGTTAVQKLGFYGALPVMRQTALAAADNTVIDAVYGATEEAVINNMRTRINELETRLQSYGYLPP